MGMQIDGSLLHSASLFPYSRVVMIGRVIGSILAIVVGVLLAVALWPQAIGVERTIGVAWVVAFRGAAAVAAAVLAVVFIGLALLMRFTRPFTALVAIFLVAFAGAQVWILSARGWANPMFPPASPETVTVLTWNTLGGEPTTRVIADLAIETEADVVSLPETTAAQAAEVVQLLAESGIHMQEFTLAYGEDYAARSTSLLISTALGPYTSDTVSTTTARLPSVIAVPESGAGPRFIAAHAYTPLASDLSTWAGDLEWLADQCLEPNTIIAGDFNSTIDHWASLAGPEPGSDLGECRDAAHEVGMAALGTWPTLLPPILGAPIDHIIATPEWEAVGFRVIGSVDGSGSDHRPVLARFAPAGS